MKGTMFMNFWFGILGFSGGLLCAVGDILFDLKGTNSRKLGKYKRIESNWEHMAPWRFRASILLASLGVPLYTLGFLSMAWQITNKPVAIAFGAFSCLGALGGIMIHCFCCVVPLLSKMLTRHVGASVIEDCVNIAFDAIKIPFIGYFLCLVIVPSGLLGYAILGGFLNLPPWCALLTAIPLMTVGISLRILKKKWFNDLPGIIMPSLSLALIGLLAAVNAIL